MFDCDFVDPNANYVLVGPQGTGKTHLLTALGYGACQKGIAVRFTRAIDMINELTTAQINGTLGKALRASTRPTLLLLDECEANSNVKQNWRSYRLDPLARPEGIGG